MEVDGEGFGFRAISCRFSGESLGAEAVEFAQATAVGRIRLSLNLVKKY